MGQELSKYREVFDMKRVNELHSQGYSLKETVVETYVDDASGRIMSKKSWVMSLKEDGKYDDIELYRAFPVTQEEQRLPDGWRIIHHTSKELLGVKKGKQPKNEIKGATEDEPDDTGVQG